MILGVGKQPMRRLLWSQQRREQLVAILFSSTAPGTAVRVSLPSASPALIRTGLSSTDGIVMTGIGFNLQANVQYLQTLNERVYVYVYGDNPGQAVISGVAVSRLCNSSVASGFREAWLFYQRNKVSRTSRRSSIIVAGVTIRGYIDKFASRFSNAETGLIGFDVYMTVIE